MVTDDDGAKTRDRLARRERLHAAIERLSAPKILSMTKLEAFTRARELIGGGAFVATRSTEVAMHRKVVGARRYDGRVEILGHGRTWEQAIEMAEGKKGDMMLAEAGIG